MTFNEVRQKYLDYFKSRGHIVLPSASLIPENDPTTLFTGSGMQPMVPFLLGQPHPEGRRLADSQKCFRSQDIEEVGDNRHTTFFEMLGNWSLGDYFKKEQVPWMFDFLVNHVGIDPRKLYITCFIGDAQFSIPKDVEAAELWQKEFGRLGIEAEVADIGSEEAGYQRGIKSGERIFYYEGKKNWWNRGKTGPTTTPVGDPCGPDSEMFYDFGTPHDVKWGKYCHPNCDCGRFMEIGNNVFMAYKKEAEGVFTPLASPNIDHGSGLERIAAAANKEPDVFRGDVFVAMGGVIEALSGKVYGQKAEETKAFRVIMDHLRAATFLIADGAVPSNKDQGYFTRRLIRRAVRMASRLGVQEMVCVRLAQSVIASYQDAYPQLLSRQQAIVDELQAEEEKFRKTLQAGLKEFQKLIGQAAITGEQAFLLFSSYGFPLEMTQELAAENNLSVDTIGFEKEMDKHRDLSRLGAEQKFAGGLADHSVESTRLHTATHLLHAALRQVLGEHVYQKGSNITPERLRFDFSHPEKMTKEQIKQVEDLVNGVISHDVTVAFEEMGIDEARKKGAIGVFEERYGNRVKVYKIGDFSYEICGGPHVLHTGELGGFKILKEEACSSGVRRIKAILS